MGLFSVARWIVLTFTFILAIVVLGVSGHLIAIRTTDYWRFAALAVAVSSITIITFPIILLCSLFIHSTASLIAEGCWLTIMWILWLATGANATHAARKRFTSGACSFFTIYGSKTCNEFRLVEALSYIIFIILLVYSISLFARAFTTRENTAQQGPEAGQVPRQPVAAR